MSLEYKLTIIFIIVGSLNVILRKNRNWIFGYRSPRAIKTHKSFAYANAIYGGTMVVAGVIYFLLINFFESIIRDLSGTTKIVLLTSFFAVLVLIIEFRLAKIFKDQ